MDPATAYNIMCDRSSAGLDERADAAAALLDWLNSGGMVPTIAKRDAPRVAGVPQTRTHIYKVAANTLAEAWQAR